MIIAASIIAGRALAPVDQVIGQWRAIGRAREAHHRLREIFGHLPADKPRVDLPAPAGDLRVSSLTKLAPAGAGGRGGAPAHSRPGELCAVTR